MNLLDLLDLYALENDSDNLFLMLQDYHLDNRIDRDMMNRIILKELGALRPASNTTKVFKFMLEEWFDKWGYNISKYIDTMYYEYDPLKNKDIRREEDETLTRDDSTTNTRTDNLTGSDDNTSNINTSAYDVSTYQPRTQTITSGTERDTGTVKNDGSLDRTDNRDLDVHEYGKDGNESYQSLIEQERKLAEFNIFEWIIKQMRRELFLLVY